MAQVGVWAALGAFMAGGLLGGCPYADQIRSDIVSLRTLLVTLFFSTIGMLADPMWLIAEYHYVYVGIIVVAIVVGKGAIIEHALNRFHKMRCKPVKTHKPSDILATLNTDKNE